MSAPILDDAALAAMSDDELVAYIEALTVDIDAAPIARPARVRAFKAARDRDPQIQVKVLAQAAGGMTTSGVINALRAAREKDHAEGLHKGKRNAVEDCLLCNPRG